MVKTGMGCCLQDRDEILANNCGCRLIRNKKLNSSVLFNEMGQAKLPYLYFFSETLSNMEHVARYTSCRLSIDHWLWTDCYLERRYTQNASCPVLDLGFVPQYSLRPTDERQASKSRLKSKSCKVDLVRQIYNYRCILPPRKDRYFNLEMGWCGIQRDPDCGMFRNWSSVMKCQQNLQGWSNEEEKQCSTPQRLD